MPQYLTKEKKEEIFTQFGGDVKNTGSITGQVALCTFRIQSLSEHLKTNNKDHACRKALLTLVGKRKRLLKYVAKKDITEYRSLIEKLNIRK